MKTLVLLSVSLAVALAMPPFAPDVAHNPVLAEGDRSPLLGDVVPVQGHVVVEDPGPQVKLQQQELGPAPVDKEQGQSVAELEMKVKPEVVEKQDGEVKTEPEPKAEPEVKVEQEGQENPEVKVEQELKEEPEVKVEQEGQENPEVKVEQELKEEPEVKVEPDVNLNPDVKAELEESVKTEVELEPELKDDPDYKVESDVKVELAVQKETAPEVSPMFHEEPQEEFPVQMNLEPETETGQEVNERHLDMERQYEMVDRPIMELEPLDDVNMLAEEPSNEEPSEVEKALKSAFQEEPLPEEMWGMRERDYVLQGEPIMELEPEMEEEHTHQQVMPIMEEGPALDMMGQPILSLEESFPKEEARMGKQQDSLTMEEEHTHQQVMPNAAIMDEGPALDMMGQPIQSLEERFPNEEARMGMEKQQDFLTMEGSHYLMMDNLGRGVVEEEPSPIHGMSYFEEPAMEDRPALDGGFPFGVMPHGGNGALIRQEVENPVGGRLLPAQDNQAARQRYCPGVILEGKCYQFFKGPKAAADAEFFCQEHFPGGHLASITSQHVHRQVMNMMLQQNGAHTRTWIGGLRYLKTGRFIWLDGSQWSYADWLSGEPNNTAGVEECVEVLGFGNGKFNDFTCWEPQAFICSYSHQ